MITTVIFDMDGVLIDSEPVHRDLNLRFFRSIGAPVSEEEYIAEFVGMPLEQMLHILKDRFCLTADAGELLRQSSEALIQEFGRRKLEPIGSVRNLLTGLQERKMNLAVASSSSSELIDLILDRTGLDPFFPLKLSGYQVPKGKPHPDIYLKTASELKVPPECCLVIEDSCLGIAAAASAGMTPVAYANPASGKQDLSRARFVLDSYRREGREALFSFIDSL